MPQQQHHNISSLSGLRESREQIFWCGGIIITYSRCSKCWNTLYMYKEDLLWVWREWGASIIRNNRDPPPTPRRYTLRSQRTNIRVWRHPYDLWPVAAVGPPPPPRRSTLRLRLHRDRQHPVTVTGAELHYTCMYQACYEYEVGGLPQSYPNTHCKWQTKRISYCHHQHQLLWN
jgi:hypothetical protein